MNDQDRKYLRDIDKFGPNLKIFKKMVEILKATENETAELLNKANNYLLEKPVIIN